MCPMSEEWNTSWFIVFSINMCVYYAHHCNEMGYREEKWGTLAYMLSLASYHLSVLFGQVVISLVNPQMTSFLFSV